MPIVTGEDNHSVSQHIDKMKSLCDTNNNDINILNDRMDRTKEHRFNVYRNNAIQEILDMYPVLSLENQLRNNLQRYFQINIEENFSRFFSQNKIDKMMDIAKNAETINKIS